MAEFQEMTNTNLPAEFRDIHGEQEAIVSGMREGNIMYCSFAADTIEDKKRLANASMGAGEPLIENTKEPIDVVDVLVSAVTLTRDDGGVDVAPRTVLLTADDKVYTATSWGLYRSVQKINMIFGTLHFDRSAPLRVQAHRIKTKKGQTISLELL